jgi:hypothetical protein
MQQHFNVWLTKAAAAAACAAQLAFSHVSRLYVQHCSLPMLCTLQLRQQPGCDRHTKPEPERVVCAAPSEEAAGECNRLELSS